jgi:hypothetical protein
MSSNGRHHNGTASYPMSEVQHIQLRLKVLSFLEWRIIEDHAKLEQLRNQNNDDHETKQFGTA